MLTFYAVIKFGAISHQYIAMFSTLPEAREYVRAHTSLRHNPGYEVREVNFTAPHYMGEKNLA